MHEAECSPDLYLDIEKLNDNVKSLNQFLLSVSDEKVIRNVLSSSIGLDEFDINSGKKIQYIFHDKKLIVFGRVPTPKLSRSGVETTLYKLVCINNSIKEILHGTDVIPVLCFPVIKDEGKQSCNCDYASVKLLFMCDILGIRIMPNYFHDIIGTQLHDRTQDLRVAKGGYLYNNAFTKNEIIRLHNNADHMTTGEWNHTEIKKNLLNVMYEQIDMYSKIESEHNVPFHDYTADRLRFKKITDDNGNLDIYKFRNVLLENSRKAADIESSVVHESEFIKDGESKSSIKIIYGSSEHNYINHAPDVLLIDDSVCHLKECKNTTLKKKIPSGGSINDGCSRVVFYSSCKKAVRHSEEYDLDVTLSLTGGISSSLNMPSKNEELNTFCSNEGLKKADTTIINKLNNFATVLGINVEISPNINNGEGTAVENKNTVEISGR